jgi:hypothetical protein
MSSPLSAKRLLNRGRTTSASLTGLACRYKHLENESRQIVAFLVPGDARDSEIFILNAMDHSIGTLSASVVTSVSRVTA